MVQKSLVKALNVIDLMSGGHKKDYGVTELASAAQTSKSTIYNILSTMESMGFVLQYPDTKRYRLAVRFLEIARNVASQTVQEQIAAVIEQIAKLTGEVCYYGIPYRDKVMYVAAAYSEGPLFRRPVTGMTAPLVCTGIGKAMLAHFDHDRQAEILRRPLKRFTDNTITDAVLLKEELRRIKAQGYSVGNMEHELGVKCVAVPVFDDGKKLTGAISLTGPSLRFPQEKIEEYAVLLKSRAREIGGAP